MKISYKIILLVSLVFNIANAHAERWHFGPGLSIATGPKDVLDIYENNFSVDRPFIVIDTALLPIGVSLDAYYQYDSGIRLGTGIGPLFAIIGEGSHVEVPINATVGFTLLKNSNVSPYIKVGIVQHLASGDYVENSDAGLLTAVGLEFTKKGSTKFALELAVDKSELELNRLDLGPNETEVINSYDVVVTARVLF